MKNYMGYRQKIRASCRFRRQYATLAETSHPFLKPSSFGQPVFSSHPHLVQSHEISPGFSLREYASRRSKLMALLPDSSMVVSLAAPIKYMSGDIFYKYRQSSDFWYLTGVQEPESAVVLEKLSSSDYRMTLFCRGKDSEREQWDGARTSIQDARTMFGADEAQFIGDLPQFLKDLTPRYAHMFVDGSPARGRRGINKPLHEWVKYFDSRSRRGYDGLLDSPSVAKRCHLSPELAKIRAIKSSAEVHAMRAAADLSGRAHTKTMRFTMPGMSENALAAHFEYICALSGSQRPAYVPVIASGSNALIIHYTNNNQTIREDELVLVDAGCELNGYASDITRTYPASGTFSSPQRDLYSAVLATQKSCIKYCTESAGVSLNDLHRKSCELLRLELKQLGFDLSIGVLEREIYPHYLSHPVGIDLHESMHFDRSAPLKDGMVVTIEPGVYVHSSSSFPRHFHGMGIRIEDEILVGENHATILSIAAPKEIPDVEAACQGLMGLEAH